MMPFLKIALIAAAAAIAGYMVHDAFYGPPIEVLKRSTVTAKSEVGNRTATAETRYVRRGERTYWEVKAPDGGWLDCGGNCAQAFREEVIDFWRQQHIDGPQSGK